MYIKILSVCVNGSSSFATVCFVCTIIDMWIYWYNFSLQNSLNEKGKWGFVSVTVNRHESKHKFTKTPSLHYTLIYSAFTLNNT